MDATCITSACFTFALVKQNSRTAVTYSVAYCRYAGKVYEHVLGEDKYTFVEDVRHPTSCTILIKGPADHTLAQIKDAIRDGLRAVKNTLDDGALVLGAGAFEVQHPCMLRKCVRAVPCP